MGVLLALTLPGPAVGQQPQQIDVSGTVTSATGDRLRGVTVRVRGSATSTVTDDNGKYTLTAPSDGVLTFGLIGFRGVGQNIGGRTTINVAMERAISVLPEVVVTGYSTQKRTDITGAVTSVDLGSIERQTSASVLQKLDGRVAGVTIDAGGSPGSRTTVRIRGVTSFQNNDPLFIIDGTPTLDSYLNWVNPGDVGSIQVLKDASAASIYGSRASNGVVVIESKKGRPGPRQITLDVRTGVASPVRGYDSFLTLDALQYFQVLKQSYQNAKLAIPTKIYGDSLNPTVPKYIWPNNCTPNPCSSVNESAYSYPNNLIMRGSPGTNWWKTVFSPAPVADAYLGVSGGGEDNAYHVSFDYFRQDGTAAYNRYQRGTVRVNTAFNMDRLNVGENIGLALEQSYGGLADDPGGYAEDGILGKNILMQPVVPVYDIGGHFASEKSIANQSNPLAYAWSHRDDRNTNGRIFGNVFGGLDLTRRLTAKTRFGFNVGQGSVRTFTPTTPENKEPVTASQIAQDFSSFVEWTWSNTLNYVTTFNRHNVALLLGQEANRNASRGINATLANLLNTSTDYRYITDVLGDAKTKNVASRGDIGTLLSYFGKVDYNFAERYFLSFTLRRDGSSRVSPAHRWGTFPAIGAGWRLSQESFLSGNEFISNAMLRFGWGITGNQNIPSGRTKDQFGGATGATFYNIGGDGATVVPGYRQTAIGNPDLKWEENKSVNVGLDLGLWQGKGTFSVDVYDRKTDNLLFPPALPGVAGTLAPPFVNIGRMSNKGIEFSIGYAGNLGEGKFWNVTFNGSHYRNKVEKLDGSATYFFGPIYTREQNAIINEVGNPIGAFYGLAADGYYRDSLDAAQCGSGDPLGQCWADGARPGRIKFKDVNGDHHITSADRTIIGSPHPDFTAGLDLGFRWGQWDLSATLFGTFGNQIFNYQKYWYIFRVFDTNVRSDLLGNSVVLNGPCAGATCPGKVTNPNAQYPRLDVSDGFSNQFSSYYIESGTYVRLRNLQIGFTVPPGMIRWIPAARIYLQAENLFTITGYSGLDPSLPAANITGPGGFDIRDQYRGVDRGSYPSNRMISVGISTTL
jgi:TonB-linked SusC/RagA family outer membrane protein